MRGVVELLDDDIRYVQSHAGAGPAGKRASEIGVPPHMIGMWIGRLQQALAISAPVEFDYLQDWGGRQQWIHCTVQYLGPGAGAKPRFSYNATDITEAKSSDILLSAAYAISQAANKASSLDEVFKAIHGIVSIVMPAKNFYIALYDSANDLVSFPYFVDEVDVPGPPSGPRRGLTEYVLRTGRSLLCDQAKEDELRRMGEIELIGAPSPIWLGVPLLSGGKAIGVMVVQHYADPQAYGPRELQMLEYVSTEVAGAIHRKRSETSSREGTETLQTLLQGSPEPVTLIDKEGVVLAANEATAQSLGRPGAQDLVGKCVYDLLPREAAETFRARAAASIRTTSPSHFEIEINGRWIENYFHPIIGPDKAVRGLAMLGFDVTARKRAEADLRRNEDQFRLIAENISDMIAILDTEGKRVYNSPSYRDLLGDPEKLRRKDSFREIHPDDRERIQRIFQETVKTGIGQRSEYRLMLPDGRMRYIESQGSTIKDGSGKVTGVIVVARDVTERKEVDREIRLLAHAVSSTMDSYALTDLEENILFVNPSFVETYGYAEEELIGEKIAKVRSSFNEPAVVEQIVPRTKAGGWNCELLSQRKDGTTFPVELWTSVVLDDAGIPVALVFVTRDISERKRAETERRTLEEQLRQVQKLESIGTLAGGIAHDFNNILAIAIGYTHLLNRTVNEPAKFQAAIEGMNNAIQRGGGLVRQLLTFARKSEAVFGRFDINSTVVELTTMLNATFPKSIAIETRLDPGLPAIMADASQIHQALLNLCINARDAMPGGGTIIVSTDTISGTAMKARIALAEEREHIHVRLSDSGSGMDEATRQRIFEPFFTTKEKGKGTGLGLAVVYGVVKSHHGFIDVESEPGRGTTFHMFFPVDQGEVSWTRRVTEATRSLQGGNETILLVEDEALLRNLLTTLLEGEGYQVLTAEDGNEATEVYAVHKDKIAVVVVDFDLPGANGWEAFQKMKEINPAVRAIFTSGYLDPEMSDRLSRGGVYGVITKPFLAEDMIARIREVIDEG